MKEITGLISRNLLGETPRQEEKRLLNEFSKKISKGKSSKDIREIKRIKKIYLKNTTLRQKKLNDAIFKAVEKSDKIMVEKILRDRKNKMGEGKF